MQLYEFTTATNEDGGRVVRVHARVADHEIDVSQSEWIEFQFEVDWPTGQNAAFQRQLALKRASEELQTLARHFLRIADQSQT